MVQHIKRINAVVRNPADAYAVPVFLVGFAFFVLIPPAHKAGLIGFVAVFVVCHGCSPFTFA